MLTAEGRARSTQPVSQPPTATSYGLHPTPMAHGLRYRHTAMTDDLAAHASSSTVYGAQPSPTTYSLQPWTMAYDLQPTAMDYDLQPTAVAHGLRPTAMAYDIEPTAVAHGL